MNRFKLQWSARLPEHLYRQPSVYDKEGGQLKGRESETDECELRGVSLSVRPGGFDFSCFTCVNIESSHPPFSCTQLFRYTMAPKSLKSPTIHAAAEFPQIGVILRILTLAPSSFPYNSSRLRPYAKPLTGSDITMFAFQYLPGRKKCHRTCRRSIAPWLTVCK